MRESQPNPANFCSRIDLKIPLVGFYDAPDPAAFEPLVKPSPGECVFAFYDKWAEGKTLLISREHYGCGGAGRWMCGVETRARRDFISFLVDQEGLKASHELMEKWIDASKPYKSRYPHILIGPLKEDQWQYAKSITFFANPDQIAALSYGAQYCSTPEDPPPLIAPFGAGCMQLLPFDDLTIPQASIGTTDIAMRQHIPPDILGFTVTKSMFRQFCELDKRSFLYKPFLKNLRKARGLPDL
ncbi:MAG: DUF169 domain-containing protein [Candidatus Aminicenantes bacterium]|nr:MAG: DUF169 domain-containing protein [Candidatus Aminicenantes bacterium]